MRKKKQRWSQWEQCLLSEVLFHRQSVNLQSSWTHFHFTSQHKMATSCMDYITRLHRHSLLNVLFDDQSAASKCIHPYVCLKAKHCNQLIIQMKVFTFCRGESSMCLFSGISWLPAAGCLPAAELVQDNQILTVHNNRVLFTPCLTLTYDHINH